MSGHKTRNKTKCDVFGTPEGLPQNVLQTYENEMKDYLYTKSSMMITREKEPNIKEICEIVSSKMEKIWETASITTISHQRVIHLLREYCDKNRKLFKFSETCKKTSTYINKFKKN